MLFLLNTVSWELKCPVAWGRLLRCGKRRKLTRPRKVRKLTRFTRPRLDDVIGAVTDDWEGETLQRSCLHMDSTAGDAVLVSHVQR